MQIFSVVSSRAIKFSFTNNQHNYAVKKIQFKTPTVILEAYFFIATFNYVRSRCVCSSQDDVAVKYKRVGSEVLLGNLIKFHSIFRVGRPDLFTL